MKPGPCPGWIRDRGTTTVPGGSRCVSTCSPPCKFQFITPSGQLITKQCWIRIGIRYALISKPGLISSRRIQLYNDGTKGNEVSSRVGFGWDVIDHSADGFQRFGSVIGISGDAKDFPIRDSFPDAADNALCPGGFPALGPARTSLSC